MLPPTHHFSRIGLGLLSRVLCYRRLRCFANGTFCCCTATLRIPTRFLSFRVSAGGALLLLNLRLILILGCTFSRVPIAVPLFVFSELRGDVPFSLYRHPLFA